MIPIVLTRDGALLYAEIEDLHETDPAVDEPASFNPVYELQDSAGSDTGLGTVQVGWIDAETVTGEFGYDVSGLEAQLEPWKPWNVIPDYEPNKYANNAHPVLLETGWVDFKSPYARKTFSRIRIKMDRQIPCHVFLEARTDEGINRQVWREDVFQADGDIGINFKARGKKIQFRILMVMFNDYPNILRGLEVKFQTSGNSVK